ncbi:hypothetical protein [Bythopirellula goksoeyrii]|nr:hypothetical protein [Bythopirellula goksoeyrii]
MTHAQTADENQLLDGLVADTEQAVEPETKKPAIDKQKKPPLEIGPLAPRLGQEVGELAEEGPVLMIKPGHWGSTSQSMKANYTDFVGNLSFETVDASQRPVALEHTHFGLQTTRTLVLAKGRAKQIQADLFIPQQTTGEFLSAKLFDESSAAEVYRAQLKLVRLPAYQYTIVVLAKDPDQYAYLKVTNTVRAPWEEEYEENSAPHYQVALVNATKEIPLSDNPLTWTNIAYLFWDEVDPTRLTSEQQKALVDWLHWGGRLIINGPDSLATLRGSFLEEYLPADDAGPRQITNSHLIPWSAYWGERAKGKAIPPLAPIKPLAAIELKPHEKSAELVGGAELFYERVVGNGSVVVSAVQLSDRDFINWPGFDGFLNSGLLQRPGRLFSEGPYGGPRVNWTEYPERRLDAHFTTPLRLFARDALAAANTKLDTTTSSDQFGQFQQNSQLKVDRSGGLGAWDEFSPVAQIARELLLLAAGVQVPGAGFVLTCLGVYLLILVPLNWLVFRVIERVEWAWFAVPLIALLGTWVVVKQAQLDIGFVRAQTEVALLELHGNYPRGILTRFTAFYSSLSTTYDITFPEDSTALALPFPANDTDQTDWQHSVRFERNSETQLSGLAVSSASTNLVHSEQMLKLDGPLRFGESSRGQRQVENRTQFELRDAVLVRRFYDKQNRVRYDGAWLGDLRAGDSALLTLLPMDLSNDRLPFESDRATSAKLRGELPLSVDSLVQLAFRFPAGDDPGATHREEYRLVGIVDGVLPSMEVEPAASQLQGATVVVAHLAYGDFSPPLPDANSITDVITQQTSDEKL